MARRGVISRVSTGHCPMKQNARRGQVPGTSKVREEVFPRLHGDPGPGSAPSIAKPKRRVIQTRGHWPKGHIELEQDAVFSIHAHRKAAAHIIQFHLAKKRGAAC